jgi:tetratricopeptide (TPR) repeat protein
MAWRSLKDYERAIADYDKAIAISPDESAAYNNLAWLLATCDDPQFRDGKRAVEVATRACELSKWTDPNQIDTLAAALAEAGEFTRAVSMQERANAGFKGDIYPERGRRRLALYRRNEPYRED